MKLSTVWSNYPSGRDKCRPIDRAVDDRPPDLDACVVSFISYIANGREPVFEHRPGIRRTLDRAFRVRVEQRREVVTSRIPFMLHVHAKVSMRVHHPGHDG